MNLNTVIAPAYWELMEPAEGRFNFTLVDDLIKNARLNHIRVVLLWFGSWKNSMACYAPAWVKTDENRFPRTKDKDGIPQEILSPFYKNNLEADKKAFVQLMQHLKTVDQVQHTVIAVQVENEIGMLPDARSYDAKANQSFSQPVPPALTNYLQDHKNTLLPELKAQWQHNSYKTAGTWEELFGKGPATDEIFTAWYFATYTNAITLAGKAQYNLPMYLNAALNRPNVLPGSYPSGGPLPHIMDIWKAGAPAIDIMAPDIYSPDFKHWADLYTRIPNPLFIPEIKFEKDDDAKAFFAFGNYNCLSFSPFYIESTSDATKEPVGRAYGILKQLVPLITTYGPRNTVKGFLLSKDSAMQTVRLGNYILQVKHDNTLEWSPGREKKEWPLTGGIIIAVNDHEFYIAGTGIVVTFKTLDANTHAGLLSVDEGGFEKGKWIPGRRLNGDEDHQGRHVRIPIGEYGIQHVQLYTY
jgi:beta-galactosidase GanA